MSDNIMEILKRHYIEYPTQDNEGYTPHRGDFKCGWFSCYRYFQSKLEQNGKLKQENDLLREAVIYYSVEPNTAKKNGCCVTNIKAVKTLKAIEKLKGKDNVCK